VTRYATFFLIVTVRLYGSLRETSSLRHVRRARGTHSKFQIPHS